MAIIEVKADVTGGVWKYLTSVGNQVREGDELAILESMKMEIPVLAPSNGTVKEIIVNEGDPCNEDDTLLIMEL